jgi:hypothetical protein
MNSLELPDVITVTLYDIRRDKYDSCIIIFNFPLFQLTRKHTVEPGRSSLRPTDQRR